MAWLKLSGWGWAQTTSTSIRRDRTSSSGREAGEQALLDGRPLVVGDREQRRVSRPSGLAGDQRGAMVAQDALEASAEPLDRLPAALVAGIGGDGHPVDVPHVEGVAE